MEYGKCSLVLLLGVASLLPITLQAQSSNAPASTKRTYDRRVTMDEVPISFTPSSKPDQSREPSIFKSDSPFKTDWNQPANADAYNMLMMAPRYAPSPDKEGKKKNKNWLLPSSESGEKRDSQARWGWLADDVVQIQQTRDNDAAKDEEQEQQELTPTRGLSDIGNNHQGEKWIDSNRFKPMESKQNSDAHDDTASSADPLLAGQNIGTTPKQDSATTGRSEMNPSAMEQAGIDVRTLTGSSSSWETPEEKQAQEPLLPQTRALLSSYNSTPGSQGTDLRTHDPTKLSTDTSRFSAPSTLQPISFSSTPSTYSPAGTLNAGFISRSSFTPVMSTKSSIKSTDNFAIPTAGEGAFKPLQPIRSISSDKSDSGFGY